MIKGERIYLRPVAMRDIDVVLHWENNPELWSVTETPGPFSRSEIAEFIRTSHNVFRQNQMRWMICDIEDQPIGALDVFDFNHQKKSSGIGILIAEKQNRNKGFASEALKLFIHFATDTLKFKSLHCIVHIDNHSSVRLFEKNNFKTQGVSYFKEKKVYQFHLELT